jgi:hypothetical protein
MTIENSICAECGGPNKRLAVSNLCSSCQKAGLKQLSIDRVRLSANELENKYPQYEAGYGRSESDPPSNPDSYFKGPKSKKKNQ